VPAARSQLAAGFAETDPARAPPELSRYVQLSYNIGWSGAENDLRSRYARRLIEGRGVAKKKRGENLATVDAGRARVDAPWRPREAEIVAALAPFSGESPRAVKQFVNVYRI